MVNITIGLLHMSGNRQEQNQYNNKTASFQKEAMRTQVAL